MRNFIKCCLIGCCLLFVTGCRVLKDGHGTSNVYQAYRIMGELMPGIDQSLMFGNNSNDALSTNREVIVIIRVQNNLQLQQAKTRLLDEGILIKEIVPVVH